MIHDLDESCKWFFFTFYKHNTYKNIEFQQIIHDYANNLINKHTVIF